MEKTGGDTGRTVQGRSPWMILIVTSIAALTAVFNGSTLNVALPTLMRVLHAPVTDIGWVMMSYMVVMAVAVVHAGKLADRLGRKRVFLIGMAIFAAGALASGFSRNVVALIIFRALQALGGATVMANSTAIVTDAFPADRRGSALGINGMVIGAGSVVGPIIGGVLLSVASWQWIFWFNVPIAGVVLLLGSRILPYYPSNPQHRRFDVWGTLALVVGLLALLGAITYGTLMGWGHPLIVALFLLGVLACGGFWEAERHAEDPIIRFALFRRRGYAVGNVSVFLNALARMSVMFLMIFYLQGARGYTPLQAAIAMIPMALPMMILGPIAGTFSDRIGSRLLTSGGLFLAAIGLWGMSTVGDRSSIFYVAIWLAVIGAGSGLFNSPNTVSIMNSVPNDYRGVAAGTRTMLNNLGMLFSLSVTVGLMGAVLPNANVFAAAHGASAFPTGPFLHTTHLIFWGATLINVAAAVLSMFRESKPPRSRPRSQRMHLSVQVGDAAH